MADKNKLYPHLMPREIIIWEKWLELNQQRFELYEYDIRVGESIIPPPNIDANIAQMAVDLAKKPQLPAPLRPRVPRGPRSRGPSHRDPLDS